VDQRKALLDKGLPPQAVPLRNRGAPQNEEREGNYENMMQQLGAIPVPVDVQERIPEGTSQPTLYTGRSSVGRLLFHGL
jgi:hypothetical protein